MTGFDWSGLMQAAAKLGIAPREFWALTPAELTLLLGRRTGGPALSRARLEELAAAFPDHVTRENTDGQE